MHNKYQATASSTHTQLPPLFIHPPPATYHMLGLYVFKRTQPRIHRLALCIQRRLCCKFRKLFPKRRDGALGIPSIACTVELIRLPIGDIGGIILHEAYRLPHGDHQGCVVAEGTFAGAGVAIEESVAHAQQLEDALLCVGG